MEEGYYAYVMDMAEREDYINMRTLKELAEGILDCEDILDERFKKMLIDISNKALSGQLLTEKQEEVLKNCYRFNDRFWE